jgi:hypothetical protein
MRRSGLPMAIENYIPIKRASASIHQATIRLPTLLEDILPLFKTPAMKYTKISVFLKHRPKWIKMKNC